MEKTFFLMLLVLLLLGCDGEEKRQIRSLNTALSFLNSENKNLHNEINTIRNKNKGLNDAITVIRYKNKNLHDRIKKLRNENKNIYNENNLLKLKLTKLKETLELVMQVNFIGEIPNPPPTYKSSGIYKEVFNPNYAYRVISDKLNFRKYHSVKSNIKAVLSKDDIIYPILIDNKTVIKNGYMKVKIPENSIQSPPIQGWVFSPSIELF